MKPWFTDEEARTFMNKEHALVRSVIDGYCLHRLDWMDLRLLNLNLSVGLRRGGAEPPQAIALLDGHGRRAEPYWDGAIVWPPSNPVGQLLESTGVAPKSLDRKYGLKAGTTWKLAHGKLARIPLQVLSEIAPQLGADDISVESFETTYRMARSKVTLHRLRLPSGIPGPLAGRYESPVLVSLAVELSEACVRLLQDCPAMGKCARPGCGRVFVTRPRGHGKRYCGSSCQRKAWEAGTL